DALPISSAIPATERSARAEYMGRQMNVFAQVGRAVGSTCASQPAPLACQQPSLVIGHWSLVIRYALLLLGVFATLGAAPAFAQCSYSISPTNTQRGYGATTQLVTVTASSNCTWTVQNTNTWIQIASITASNVSFNFDANPSLTERTGLVTIATQIFTLRQRGISCTYSISPAQTTRGFGATTNFFTVKPNSAECSWIVENTNTWIRIVPPGEGVGTNDVWYELLANFGNWRTGLVYVADEFITIIQRPSNCNYLMAPTATNVAYRAFTGEVAVTTAVGCSWSVYDKDSWITLIFGASGNGPATIRYRIPQNPTALPRVGSFSVADQTYTITQAAAPCTYSFTPTNQVRSLQAETGQFALNALVGCSWRLINTNNWITIL